MKERVRELIEQGDRLFSKRRGLQTFWQELAENFYPERADFTLTSTWLGRDFASNLMTGMPVLARRTLGDQFGAMLRPRDKTWFNSVPEDERLADDASAKAYLERCDKTMRRIMYAPQGRFLRATKECDHDYATFGQGVITVELSKSKDFILYRSWHLRDTVWAENAEGAIDTIHRNWTMEARQVKQMWPKTVSKTVSDMCDQNDAHREIKIRHIILPAGEYDYKDKKAEKQAQRLPFMSIYVDCENDTILEETRLPDHPYVIPRWQTVAGSQYAHSPATIVSVPDARLLQRITLTLLEAGEKAVNPPIVAMKEAIRSDIQVFSGGVTWVDMEYDERRGDPLRALDLGAKNGLAFGGDIVTKYEAVIREAFYLDKINLPPMAGGDMTAYEVQARVKEYIRAALPLFEPVEVDYSASLCEKTFGVALRNGAFGPIDLMPRQLGGMDIKFKFESPLAEAVEREKVAQFRDSAELLKVASEMDPNIASEVDIRTAFRDAFTGTGAPSKWLFSDEQAVQARSTAMQTQATMAAAKQAEMAGGIAQQVGDGAQALQASGLIPGASEMASA